MTLSGVVFGYFKRKGKKPKELILFKLCKYARAENVNFSFVCYVTKEQSEDLLRFNLQNLNNVFFRNKMLWNILY